MVGSALAAGLAQRNLKIAVVEQSLPQPFDVEQPPDLRMSAFSMASVNLLRSLGDLKVTVFAVSGLSMKSDPLQFRPLKRAAFDIEDPYIAGRGIPHLYRW